MTLTRKLQWLAIFTVLSGFTFMQAGAAYALRDDHFMRDSVESEHSIYFEEREGRVTRHRYVCNITPEQLELVKELYRVSTTTVTKHGKPYTVALVDTGRRLRNSRELRSIVGNNIGQCRQRILRSYFYIFTVPGLS